MQSCTGMVYAAMCRCGVCNHEKGLSMQPCGGVKYTSMWRNGVGNHV